ncbi:unnamed protein product [Ceutorhynchus assimilis]|uniref:Uncharacterized protein n=1 Tax=Ceutorhynchus assimilis TaxID=467358 RepID=A0A9N9MTQ1_9CUCU|nr:unnamed protein product [Ceutorhynchus assimilis]
MVPLSVPSPDKEEGLEGEASNLPSIKQSLYSQNPSIASEQDGFNVDDTSEDKENETEQTHQEANKAGMLEHICAISETKKRGKTIPQHEGIIIMGDLNSRVGNKVIPEVKNRFNEETVNERG